jgi:intracellular sulfur oxidation DsrE/DsrF family protein
MQDDELGPNRRRFLVKVAGASTVLAAAAVADAASAQKLAPAHPAMAASAHGEWNLRWVERVAAAKHKAVFDSPEIAGGTALANAFFCLRDYASVYQASDADMGVVVVVRHFGIPLVFGDASWSRFKLGEMAKVKDPVTGEDALRNPFLHPKPGDKTMLPIAGAEVDTLIGRGVVFLCCNEALKHFAETIAKTASITGEEARQALTASLVPGALLVPSGIFGLTRAGEAGCHYIRST